MEKRPYPGSKFSTFIPFIAKNLALSFWPKYNSHPWAEARVRGEGARGPARGRGEAVAAVAGLQGTQPGQQVSTLTAAAALVAPEHEQSLLHI